MQKYLTKFSISTIVTRKKNAFSVMFIFIALSMLLSACGSEGNFPQIEAQEIQAESEEALQDLQAELYALQAEIEEARLQLNLQNELVQIDYENETDYANHEEV